MAISSIGSAGDVGDKTVGSVGVDSLLIDFD